jgi:hypothetical protein
LQTLNGKKFRVFSVNAALVKGLRRIPFTDESRVRFPYAVLLLVSYQYLTIVKSHHHQPFGGFFIFATFVKIRSFFVVFATDVLRILANPLWPSSYVTYHNPNLKLETYESAYHCRGHIRKILQQILL